MIKLAHIPKGTYVVGVSGGVDSVVLLDVLSRQSDIQLVVAHVDHGMREESTKDEHFVQQLANKYGFKYESVRLELGKKASEETAREARYKFFRECLNKHKAQAVVTAHHQDDVLETIIINLLRGTGWRGLSSLRSHATTVRPLLHVPKTEIKLYAKSHGLPWHEDQSNNDTKYLRNYVRHNFMPHINKQQDIREALLSVWQKQIVILNDVTLELTTLMQQHLVIKDNHLYIDRYYLIMLPHSVALELLQAAIHKCSGQRLERPQALSMLLFAKVAKANKHFIANQNIRCLVTESSLIVEPTHI